MRALFVGFHFVFLARHGLGRLACRFRCRLLGRCLGFFRACRWLALRSLSIRRGGFRLGCFRLSARLFLGAAAFHAGGDELDRLFHGHGFRCHILWDRRVDFPELYIGAVLAGKNLNLTALRGVLAENLDRSWRYEPLCHWHWPRHPQLTPPRD